MHRVRSLLSLVSLVTLLAGMIATPVQAQQSPAELANDGMSLARETWPTRSTFATIFGERAPSAWKAEHEAEMAVGRPGAPGPPGVFGPEQRTWRHQRDRSGTRSSRRCAASAMSRAVTS